LFCYDHESGLITYRTDHRFGHRGTQVLKAGSVAGGVDRSHRYLHIRVDGVKYYAHRIAWALFYGEEPPAEIDHIDHNKANNAIWNLRAASHRQNMANSSIKKNNISGVPGVYRNHAGKWEAFIQLNGKSKTLGSFADFDAAVAARVRAAAQYWGEFSPHCDREQGVTP
jgi:HNH endonuclease